METLCDPMLGLVFIVDMLCVIIELNGVVTLDEIPPDNVLCDVGAKEVALEPRLLLGLRVTISTAAIIAATIAMNVMMDVIAQQLG